jgi:hypothetical protein
MDATLIGVYNELWETEKKQLHRRPRSLSSCQLSRYPPFSTINVSFIVSCAPPSFINLGMGFLLRGRGVTSHVTEILIKLIKLQLSPDARLNQDIKV